MEKLMIRNIALKRFESALGIVVSSGSTFFRNKFVCRDYLTICVYVEKYL